MEHAKNVLTNFSVSEDSSIELVDGHDRGVVLREAISYLDQLRLLFQISLKVFNLVSEASQRRHCTV